MGKGPHGGLLYATHYQISWHIYAFLKVFGVLRTFLQKGSKPPEAVPPFPYKLQFLYSKISNNSGRLSTVTSGISPSWWMVSWPP